MTPRRAYLMLAAAIAGLVLAVAVIVATRPACSCVLGGHYVDPLDPADCPAHEAGTE